MRALAFGVLGALVLAASACASNEAVPGTDEHRPAKTYTVVQTDAVIHTVAPGEHLAGIADQYDVPLAQLVAINDIAAPTVIEVGDEIVIEREVLETIEIVPARTQRLPSPAASRSGVLNEFEWPTEMSLGQSAMAFVVMAGLALGMALLVVHSAASLAYEATGFPAPRLPGLRLLPRREPSPDSDDTTSTSDEEPGRRRPRIWSRAAGAGGRRLSSAWHAISAVPAGAYGLARSGSIRSAPTAKRLAVSSGRVATAAARTAWSGLRALLRRAGPLTSRAGTAARNVAIERRRRKLRAALEARAEVPARIGLIEEAEEQYQVSLAECETEGWPVEAGLCMRGLAEVAKARGDLERALELQNAALAIFEEHGAVSEALKSRMQRQIVEKRLEESSRV